MGSTRAARRAGISPAHNATTPSESAAAPNTNGSRALIWNRSQVHQLIRFVHRQRPQKNLVEVEEIATFAPIPSAMDSTAMALTTGGLNSDLEASFSNNIFESR
jgi:hypothetical protein